MNKFKFTTEKSLRKLIEKVNFYNSQEFMECEIKIFLDFKNKEIKTNIEVDNIQDFYKKIQEMYFRAVETEKQELKECILYFKENKRYKEAFIFKFGYEKIIDYDYDYNDTLISQTLKGYRFYTKLMLEDKILYLEKEIENIPLAMEIIKEHKKIHKSNFNQEKLLEKFFENIQEYEYC